MSIQPASKPRVSYDTVISAAAVEWKRKFPSTRLSDMFVLAVRSYYRDTMGAQGVDDCGLYDDAIFLVDFKAGCMTSWNGNTDPGRFGWNANAENYMLRVKPGCYTFVKRMHRGKYQAYGQGSNPVGIERVREGGVIDHSYSGCYGVNLHLGGERGTSSEGCLTVTPDQWEDFRSTLNKLLSKYDAEDGFSLILTQGPIT